MCGKIKSQFISDHGKIKTASIVGDDGLNTIKTLEKIFAGYLIPDELTHAAIGIEDTDNGNITAIGSLDVEIGFHARIS